MITLVMETIPATTEMIIPIAVQTQMPGMMLMIQVITVVVREITIRRTVLLRPEIRFQYGISEFLVPFSGVSSDSGAFVLSKT